MPQERHYIIIKEIAQRTGHKQATVRDIWNASFEVIKNIMFEQGAVKIPRFGTFSTRVQKPMVRTLPTGHVAFAGERLAPKIKWSPIFKDQLHKIQLDQKRPTKEEFETFDTPLVDD